MLHFVLQTPSLLHLSQVKTVARLWNETDIITEIATTLNGRAACRPSEYEQEWKEIEDRVKNKVSLLQIPESCKIDMLHFVKPIGMQIIAWCRYNNLDGYAFDFSDNWLPRQQLCWTMHGTINYRKTAQLMVKNEEVDVERRFELACINCLEDEARELFERMGEERRQEYVTKMHRTLRRMDHQHLFTYFTCTLTGDERGLISFLQSTHPHAGTSVNRVLFESVLTEADGGICDFWFKKLSQREKQQVLEKCQMQIREGSLSRASGLRCLSLMNGEQRGRMFRECTRAVLLCLLEWPMQSLFVEAARRGWQLMDEGDCEQVLNSIIRRIHNGFRDYDDSQLFWKCWRLSSADYKGYFLNNIYNLEFLIATKAEEFIQFVLNQASSHQLRILLDIKHFYDQISPVLMDERAISDAALMECKQTAALNSSNDPEDDEKRLRSQHVSRLVDLVIESRTKSREK